MIRKAAEPLPVDPSQRYAVAGSENFEQNVRVFNEAYGDYDGMVLQNTWTPRAQHLVGQYMRGLERFITLCKQHGVRPVLVYFPAYPQVYDADTPMTMRDALRARCTELGVVFCDLTPVFRQRGANRVLHLAPLDFHLNPDGYRLMGHAIGEFLIEQRVLDER